MYESKLKKHNLLLIADLLEAEGLKKASTTIRKCVEGRPDMED